jgi:hypothetical protein
MAGIGIYFMFPRPTYIAASNRNETSMNPCDEQQRLETRSERLNKHCFCLSLNRDRLRQALLDELKSTELINLVDERCPYLFSARPVFVSHGQIQRMAEVVSAVETVVTMPAYRQHVLGEAPAIARHDPGGAKGVFFGYDFHVRDDEIGLIEINTNAGGAMLNAVMARAHRVCCVEDQLVDIAESAEMFENGIVEMFRTEWQLSGHQGPLRSVAIVDVAPKEQYLYAEFLLFQELFERHGIHAVIADPSALNLRDGTMWHGDTAIDLVYNRLTDFALEAPEHAVLRAAYVQHSVVLTPHPQAHALYADKRNLTVLCDPDELQRLGVPLHVRDVLLANTLRTEVVEAVNAERLWDSRRKLFFKPTNGFGGRAAYRGDKITKRVWQEILAGSYVAQASMAPGDRVTGSKAEPLLLKFDLRSYAYDGSVQWTAARVYQGQTTNFRTPEGGFAPVYSWSESPGVSCADSCEVASRALTS